MTTFNVDTSSLVGRPTVLQAGSVGYSKYKMLLPNVPTLVSQSVASVAVTSAGTGYTTIPLVSFVSTTGNSAAAYATMQALTATVVTPGVGVWAPNDTITLLGGTGSEPQLGVITTQVVSASIVAGGTGGTSGTQTVTGTTGTGTDFEASVFVSLGGIITSILSIAVPGSYTTNPTTPSAEPVTGGGVTGATFNLVMGILTANVKVPGNLTALPPYPVSGTGSGAGTGGTFNMTYGVNTVVVTAGGEDYVTAPTVAFSSGAATATATVSGSGSTADVVLSFNDVIPTSNYSVKACPSQAGVVSYGTKSTQGCIVTLTPLDGTTLSAGTMDISLEYTY